MACLYRTSGGCFMLQFISVDSKHFTQSVRMWAFSNTIRQWKGSRAFVGWMCPTFLRCYFDKSGFFLSNYLSAAQEIVQTHPIRVCWHLGSMSKRWVPNSLAYDQNVFWWKTPRFNIRKTFCADTAELGSHFFVILSRCQHTAPGFESTSSQWLSNHPAWSGRVPRSLFINVRDCLLFYHSHNSLRLVLLIITCEYKQINFTLLYSAAILQNSFFFRFPLVITTTGSRWYKFDFLDCQRIMKERYLQP